jgi:cysteine desulfurase
MAKALAVATEELDESAARLEELRDMLARGILQGIEGVRRNGSARQSLPNILNLSFEGVDGESLLLALDQEGVAASTGSACTSGSSEPSHVLLAMGVPPRLAQGSLRFSLGRYNSREEIRRVLDILPGMVARLREISLKAGRGVHA